MALTKEQKTKAIEKLKDALAKQRAMVFVNFAGLKAQDIRNLRKKLKEAGAKIIVVKKTLAKIVFDSRKINLPVQDSKNELAIIFNFEDQIQPIKAAYDFSKTQDKLKIAGGYLSEGGDYEFLAAQDMIALAQLPGRNELLAGLVRAMSTPISNFMNISIANIKGLMHILSSINNQ